MWLCEANGKFLYYSDKLLYSKPGEVYLSTRVVQHHSVSCVPLVWRYPLSLALRLWRAQSQPSGERNRGETEEETARGRDQTERAMTNTSRGERSYLPQALSLRCPSPHQHRLID